MNITSDKELKWLSQDRGTATRFTEWQSDFKDFGIRRLAPNSFGSTLILERKLLKSLLETEKKS